MLRESLTLAWERLKIIAAIIGDINARFISTLFYFTILVPFGIGSRLLSDPLRVRTARAEWLNREHLPKDLESAKQQG